MHSMLKRKKCSINKKQSTIGNLERFSEKQNTIKIRKMPHFQNLGETFNILQNNNQFGNKIIKNIKNAYSIKLKENSEDKKVSLQLKRGVLRSFCQQNKIQSQGNIKLQLLQNSLRHSEATRSEALSFNQKQNEFEKTIYFPKMRNYENNSIVKKLKSNKTFYLYQSQESFVQDQDSHRQRPLLIIKRMEDKLKRQLSRRRLTYRENTSNNSNKNSLEIQGKSPKWTSFQSYNSTGSQSRVRNLRKKTNHL